MRVLLSTFGSRGDVQPFVLLAAELIRRGHDAEVVAFPDGAPFARHLGVPYRCTGRAAEEQLRRNVAATGSPLNPPEGFPGLQPEIDAEFEGMLASAAEAMPDLVLGTGVNFAAVPVAAHLGVPHCGVAFCPAIFDPGSVNLLVPELRLPRPFTVLTWKVLIAASSPAARMVDAKCADLGIEPRGWSFLDMYGPAETAIAAADREIAPTPAQLAGVLTQTAALVRPATGAPLPAEVESFLAAGDKPVYIGFGSMPVPKPERVERAVLEGVRLAGMRAIVSRGWGGLAERAGDRGDVLVIGEVEHAALFPRVAAVVHHAGAGTTATAARAGVPQIAVPTMTDQFYWGRRIAEVGLGPAPLPLKRFTRDRLAERLKEAATSAGIADRAERMAERLWDVDGVAMTADAIEARVAQGLRP